jgi:arabinogalactan oligomer/maltooligosaccharide transport system permease protein
MEQVKALRKYLPTALWILAILAIYFLLRALIQPYSAGISLNSRIVVARLREVSLFIGAIFIGIALVELYFYQIFFRAPRNRWGRWIIRLFQGLIALVMLQLVVMFFDLTDLIRLPAGAVKNFFWFPGNAVTSLQKWAIGANLVAKENASLFVSIIVLLLLGAVFALIQWLSGPRVSRVGLAYLLVIPAFIGVLFLIVYPFLFEIKLAFSNASLGTQATKNASYGLVYGWENLKTLFTGNVAKDAKFFDVFGRTILWTVITSPSTSLWGWSWRSCCTVR